MDLYTAVSKQPAHAAGLAAPSQYQRLADGGVSPPSAAVTEALPAKAKICTAVHVFRLGLQPHNPMWPVTTRFNPRALWCRIC